MRTGTLRARGIAWGLVLGWHALVGWWLLHALPRVSLRGDGDPALQVVYVSLPPLSTPLPPVPAARPSRRRHDAQRPRDARRQSTPIATAAPAPAASSLQVVADATPPAAAEKGTLLEQARVLARRQAAATAPAPDIFADRAARLPPANGGRFRMRDPLTPARALAWLGSHVLAPSGYEADPCPRNRRNIAGLIAAGDSPRLQLELAFEREHCRP